MSARQPAKKALITGSAGLIGRHMCARLFHDGWTITPLDINAKNIHSNQDAREFFGYSHTSYDLVVHCAAHVGGREDIEGRPTYIGAVNLQLDGALFEWALRTRPAHIVYWSSSAAYPVCLQDNGTSRRLREWDIDHQRPTEPDQSYGAVKLIGEQLAGWGQAEGLKVHVFRPFSGWADDQDTSYPMGAFLDRARRKADPFDVWGTGEQVRDFIHIDDVISAALTAVEQDYPGPLNLCTGVGTSFNQLAEFVCKSAGYSPAIRHWPDKPVGVHHRVGDPTEMLKVWTPKISLEEGIQRALCDAAR